MRWKVARDPFVRSLQARWGDAAVSECGFFLDDDDRHEPLDDVGWLSTPIAAAVEGMQGLEPGRTPVVLVATGAFWPPHEGHVEMVERARAGLEASGAQVVAGYLSPGHDRYLARKWGPAAPPAAARISMLESAVGRRGWLSVDPWEALHRRVAVNFTDVVARLEAYLRAHVDPRIEVAFVCGSDNARFALAFAERGRCVVVGRPGFEREMAAWRADPRLAGNGRIVWVDGTSRAASSSLDPSAWQAGPVAPLRLRLEDGRAVAGLGLGFGEARWRAFQHGLRAVLAAAGRAVHVVRVEEQQRRWSMPIISLDPMTPGTVDLGVSREFDLGGRALLGHGARPGTDPLDVQAARIPPGAYTLVDDDAMTGGTLAFAAALLPGGVRVAATETLLESAGGEIADSRDFLVGAADGGLVVRLPGGAVGRAPYVLPYVDPHARCGVPVGDVVGFSAVVWRLNEAAFAGTGMGVADLPEAARRTFETAGRDPAEPVETLCAWHASVLESRLAPPF